ncbi:MAG: CotH kinase family protein, partial [Candidatus Krumholzibacteria bacterium]|nr:CotH kinase family protein [Candidatus Krumholzibacteria bacterium]
MMCDSLKIVVACIGLVCAAPAPAAAQSPLINEFLGSNATTIADDDGDYSDWLELYNPGAATFDLTGCYLSDDAGNPLRWRFPGGSVPPQGYLLVWASGKDRQSPGGDLHTNFAISAGGEPLLLTAADGTTRLDETAPHALAADISYGRLPDGAAAWVEFAVPTPAASNSGGLLYLAPPVFSQTPGFFTNAITLAVTAPDPGAVIRYTLDGSEPTPASAIYTEPLVLDSRAGDPNTISLIPTNFRNPADLHGWRPPQGEVFKLNVVRARAFRAGHAPSAIVTGSYIVDPDLASQIPLPVVSLATAPENFFADDIGIYVPGNMYVPGNPWTGNYFQTGEEWERPLHIEIFDLQGNLLLTQGAGARIHGGFTRTLPQKTLRMYARSAYGAASFECPLFPDLPYDSFKRFLIRNSGSDWAQAAFRDLGLQTVFADMGFNTQAGRPVIHFVNGEYWGIANLRERYDRHYLVRYYGIPEDEIALLADNAEIEEGLLSDRDDYLALRSFISASDMNHAANWAHVQQLMDIQNFLNYVIAEIFGANHDWPGNNIRYWRRSISEYDPTAPYGHDGRWRWMMCDMDDGFLFPERNTLALATATNGPEWPNPPWSTALLRGLLQNEWFRRAFLNGFADHLNSTFAPNRLNGILNTFQNLYAPAIPSWHDRWDITNSWLGIINMMRTFANQRPSHMRQHILDHFQLAGTTDITLNVNNPARGKIQINSLVVDGALAGLADPAQPYPWSGIYFQGVPITVTALPEPGNRFLYWQGIPDGEAEMTLIPGTSSLNLFAVFGPDTLTPIPLHAWHFNDLPSGTLTAVAADVSLLGGAVITYPGTGAGYLDRV